MGAIIIPRNTKSFQNSSPINRSLFFDLHDRPAFHNNQEDVTDRPVPLRTPNQAGEITAVPNPTPDTGPRPTHERGTDLPPSTTLVGPSIEHLPIALTRPTLQSFSAMTSWAPVLATTPSTTIIDTFTTNITTAQPLTASDLSTGPRVRDRPPLPLAAIILIAVGGSCLLVGICITWRWFSRPRRRRFPKPSLPRFEHAITDEEKILAIQESPIFGPNERFSQRSGANPAWSWVTYPQSNAMCDPSKIKREDTLRSGNPPLPPQVAFSYNPPVYRLSGHYHTSSTPSGSLPLGTKQAVLQQTPAENSRAAHRISMTQPYKESSPMTSKEVGTSYFADGREAMKRRSRTLRKSRGHSICQERHRGSRTSIGLAYDGADVVSPVQPMGFMPLESLESRCGAHTTKVETRTRIQSPYYPTSSYPRISSGVATTYGVATRVRLGDGTSIRGADSPNLKSELQRAKELTQALGLSSPTTDELILSPQPSLCPEDSLSIVESKRLLKQRSQRRRMSTGLGGQIDPVSDERRHHLVATTTRSVVAIASGSLISAEDLRTLSTNNNMPGMNLTTSLTGPTLVNSKCSGTKSSLATTRSEPRTGDRPPRVPSPPRLPSLAQMALEHNNPDAYASYRSPTYSIYNLYDNDQKGTVGGGRKLKD